MSPKLVLEGPPGAGKTTAFAALVRGLGDRCHFFPEPCLALHDSVLQSAGSRAWQTAWYLAEQRRQYRCLAFAQAEEPVMLWDRNHLGVLAYAYADESPDGMPYQVTRERFLRAVEPTVPRELQSVILLVSPTVSLARRGGRPELPRWKRWYDRTFLERLRDFYVRHAAEFCPVPPVVVDTDGLSTLKVLDILTARLAVSGVTLETRRPPIPPQPPLAPMFAHPYERAGGFGVLGRPVTDAFVHHGRHVQLFEHGALSVDAVSA